VAKENNWYTLRTVIYSFHSFQISQIDFKKTGTEIDIELLFSPLKPKKIGIINYKKVICASIKKNNSE
jgi:hypothetical protein